MRILNQYITQEFLKPLLVCALAFLIVFLVADLNDNLEDFTSNGVSGLRILWYYGLKLPQIMVQVAPLALLLATLFTISNMERYNELIAIAPPAYTFCAPLLPLWLRLDLLLRGLFLYEFVCPDWLRQAEEFRRQLGSQEQPSNTSRPSSILRTTPKDASGPQRRSIVGTTSRKMSSSPGARSRPAHLHQAQ